MKSYLPIWILLIILLVCVGAIFLFGWEIFPGPTIGVLMAATVVALLVIANELRRPEYQEYNRRKALYPKIPDKFLADIPSSGSTGSGKSSTCVIPTILTHTNGSIFVVDIKSRELTIRTSNIYDPKTVIVDLDHQAPYVQGWDILYGLKRDGTDTEQDVLNIIREVAPIIIPKSTSGDQFWNDSARSLFMGLVIFEIVYQQNYEFIDVVLSIMNTDLRTHIETALNTVPTSSVVASYLCSMANTADETLFSCNISMCQYLYFFVSQEAIYTLRDNAHRANPRLLNSDGTRLYMAVSEEQLDCGFDRIACIIIKQVLQELQSRGTNKAYPSCMLMLDEWQRLTESVESLRLATSSFLKTARSKNASVVLCLQNMDSVDKGIMYDILSNVHYLHVLSSNNSNSLTSEVVCKMAGEYAEKENCGDY